MVLWGSMAAGLALAAAGCGGDGGSTGGGAGSGGNGNQQSIKITCSADINAATYDYSVDGDKLSLTDPLGRTVTLARRGVAAGSHAADGTWVLPTQADNNAFGLVLDASMTIDETSVKVTSVCSAGGKSVTASVSSPVTLNDDSVTFSATAHDEEYLYVQQ
jgi:hypothetical protein